MQIVIMMGTTCAGKTTHGRWLAEKFGYRYISSGDIARGLMDGDTARSFTQGGLSPHDDKIMEIINTHLDSESVGLVLDGFPRTKRHYDFLKDWVTRKTVKAEHFTPPIIVHLAVPEGVALARSTARTRDEFDTDEATKKRHELFKNTTLPIIADAVGQSQWCLLELRFTKEHPINEVQEVMRQLLERPRSGGCCVSAFL